MNVPSLLIDLAVAIVAFAPPSASDPRSVLQRTADAGITVGGRDPFVGTGLCGALLPVHLPGDVHYATLPPGFTASDLRLLRHLPNLEHIRCQQTITTQEFELIRRVAGPRTWILGNVRSKQGVVRFWTRRPAAGTIEGQRGDEIVDENGEAIIERLPSK